MKMVVVGAGQVGRAVAEDLSAHHEITVIDHDLERLEEVRFQTDVMTFEGNGADIDVLKKAKTESADIIIASTDDDRVNILVCGTAHALNPDIFTIARVTNTGYLRSWEYSKKAFSVDLMLGSDYLTAKRAVQVVFQQMAQEVAYFDGGRVEMAEFRVPPDCKLAEKTVKEVDIYEGLRYAAVFHDDKMEVARGDTLIPAGSRILVIGRSEDVREFGENIAPSHEKPASRVFILGGGEISYQIAQLMEQRGISPKIVEADRKRAEFLAKNLPKSFILNENARDPDFLKSEGLNRAHIVISALPKDEQNLFVSLQAMHLGAERVVSVVHERKYDSLFKKYGVEVTFNPRSKVIEEIIRHTRTRRLEKVTFVEHHKGEVIEVKLDQDSPLAARPLIESAKDFPDAIVIGAVSRSGRIIIPSGDTVLEVGDDLVIFVAAKHIDEVLERI